MEESVIVIEVEESRNKPHFYKNSVQKVGRTNIQLDISEIKEMILKRIQYILKNTPQS